jgi:hypothetical protein
MLDRERDELLEVLRLRVTRAGLPIPHRVARDAQKVGQAGLRQPDHRAQPQHGLPEGMVALRV